MYKERVKIKDIEKETQFPTTRIIQESHEFVREFPNGISLYLGFNSQKMELIHDNGNIMLTIDLSGNSPIVNICAGSLNIDCENELNLGAKNIKIHSKENISIHSKGDLIENIEGNHFEYTKGDHFDEAKVQNIKAHLGNVNIKANDDVELKGTMILLN
jgi:hypothetical protein